MTRGGTRGAWLFSIYAWLGVPAISTLNLGRCFTPSPHAQLRVGQCTNVVQKISGAASNRGLVYKPCIQQAIFYAPSISLSDQLVPINNFGYAIEKVEQVDQTKSVRGISTTKDDVILRTTEGRGR